jgi:hypothetical protein
MMFKDGVLLTHEFGMGPKQVGKHFSDQPKKPKKDKS